MSFSVSPHLYSLDNDTCKFSILQNEINLPKEPDLQTLRLLEKLNTLSIDSKPSKAFFKEIKKVEDVQITGPHGVINCRVYTPHALEPLPVLVFFHGGGWVSGELDEYDYFCQKICQKTPSLVVSVAYHLAPQYKFPKPLEDCYAATEWVVNHIHDYGGDSSRLAVGGDSAGGNLAAALTLMVRNKQAFKINYQVLLFPVVDHYFDSDSYRTFAEGYYLTKNLMKMFWDNYLNTEEDGQHPYASPIKASTLANLPSAFVVLARFDVLFSEGIAYTSRLLSDGVSAQLKCYPTIHAFINFEDEINFADDAIEQIAEKLKQNL